jgi:putative nucleotidyltransferase with HDIG domain
VLQVDAPEQGQAFDEIPTDRRVALRLLWLLDDPHAPLDQITRVISADPALTVRMLTLANAPYFRTAGDVTALPRAASVLGPQAVHAIASTAVLGLFASDRVELEEHFWHHAITAAVAAARVAEHVQADPAEALTAGLLHDVGEHLLRSRDPQRFDETMRAVSNESVEGRLAIERQLFGVDHATLGAQVLSRQGVPSAITDALLDHHLTTATAAPLARAVHVADSIAKIIEGDTRVDLDAALRLAGVAATGSSLVEQAEHDRRAILKFLAADFLAPRNAHR